MQATAAGVLCLLLLAVAPAGASAGRTGDRTITKVVKLLQEMLEKSKVDGAKDKELYGKFKCYCDDNEEEKRTTIEELEKEIELLTSKIAELRADTGGLSGEVADLKAAMEENEAARKEAESLRQKENEEFVKAEADMTKAISQMTEAIEVLSEIGADQTMATGADHEQYMAGGAGEAPLVQLKAQLKTAFMAAKTFLTKKQTRIVESFLQAPFTGTYTAQSGEVVGILKSMKNTFSLNLEAAIAAEKAAAEAHEKFMKTKEEAFETMKNSYDEKQANLGTNDDDLATKRDQLAEAKEQLEEDKEFLAKLLVLCAEKKKEYEERKLMRANEEAAIAEAIAVLNSDAAFESFGKVTATKTGSTGATLLQISRRQAGSAVAAVRREAEDLLRAAAGKHRSLRLAKVAAMLQAGNPFDTVLAEIEKILALIEEEGAMDKENYEWCNAEREKNNADLDEHIAQIETLEGDIEDLKIAIHDPETGLLAQIAETETSIEQNHESQESETAARAQENMAYQQDIANIVEAEDLLKKAIGILEKYYKSLEEEAETETEAAALLQQNPEDGAPTTWEGEEEHSKGYAGQRESGNKVIEMLKFILSEAGKEHAVAHEDEEAAQASFEDSMTDLKSKMATLQGTLVELKETLAEKEKTLHEKEQELVKTIEGKEAIEAYLEKIKAGCDFITENLEARDMARETETEALKKAVELIKGTPAYKAAVASAHEESLGECKDKCAESGEGHVECKACLAGVTIPGYCAGHADTEGC